MKNKKPLRTVRKWLRLHGILTGIVFGVYFFAAFFQGSGFFITDIRSKIHAIADTIALTATVLDVPAKPAITLSAVCDSGNLFVDSDWADDSNSYTYDVSRDNSLLVTGLIDSSYRDENVAAGTTYEYIVTAYGPMGPGFAVSDSVSVTIPSECASALPDPSITSNAINYAGFRFRSGIPVTSDKTPVFSGTTNMPFAEASIVIHSDQIVSLRTTANANGYWEAAVPVKLSSGDHIMYITAVDRSDSSRIATFTLSFRILEGSDNNDRSANTRHHRMTSVSVPAEEPSLKDAQEFLPHADVTGAPSIPVDFFLHIVGNRTVFQGGVIESEIVPYRVGSEYGKIPATIRYRIIDSNGSIVTTVEKRYDFLKSGESIRESTLLPSDGVVGEYILQAEILIGNFDIVRQTGFSVRELPLLSLGGGAVITYPQFVRNIGWVAFILLFSTLTWSLLWIREYWLYVHAARHVIEKSLSKKGLISKRREVSR